MTYKIVLTMRSTEWLPVSRSVRVRYRSLPRIAPRAAIGDRGRSAQINQTLLLQPSFIKLNSDLRGILYIENSGVLFIGSGSCCSCYSLADDKWLWIDTNILDFTSWILHGDAVVMRAEREVSCWNSRGRLLWGAYLSDNWSIEVDPQDLVSLADAGEVHQFNIYKGPSWVKKMKTNHLPLE